MTFPVGDLGRSLAFYRAALVDGAPGARLKYSPGSQGAFSARPDGHNVEAVWHSPWSS